MRLPVSGPAPSLAATHHVMVALAAISVRTVLGDIAARAPSADIVLLGYPMLFGNLGNCVVNVAADEANWMNSTTSLLNDNLRTTVEDAAASGVNVSFELPLAEFLGRGVCGEPEAIHNLVLQRTPGDAPAPSPSAQSFHPNLVGSPLYAQTLERELRSIGQ